MVDGHQNDGVVLSESGFLKTHFRSFRNVNAEDVGTFSLFFLTSSKISDEELETVLGIGLEGYELWIIPETVQDDGLRVDGVESIHRRKPITSMQLQKLDGVTRLPGTDQSELLAMTGTFKFVRAA